MLNEITLKFGNHFLCFQHNKNEHTFRERSANYTFVLDPQVHSAER